MRIILASESPRRRLLVQRLGADVTCVAPECDEDTEITDPRERALQLAERKALSVLARADGCVVVGADTIVVAPDGEIYGKPASADDAKRMLKTLCGKTHAVITGVCVATLQRRLVEAEQTLVSFGTYDASIVGNYIKSGKCFGKAGAYGLQDTELCDLITKVDGNVDNVIGLPVTLLDRLLKNITADDTRVKNISGKTC